MDKDPKKEKHVMPGIGAKGRQFLPVGGHEGVPKATANLSRAPPTVSRSGAIPAADYSAINTQKKTRG